MSQNYKLNRPDEQAMEQLLDRHEYDAAGVVLRLAWKAGLVREEIVSLTWKQVDLRERLLRLRDRTVPLTDEMAAYLAQLRERNGGDGETAVLLSDRDRKPMAAESVSRLARSALNGAGQRQVRLLDLRHDYVLRLLAGHDWQYVSRVCGIDSAALKLHFAVCLPESRFSTRSRGSGGVDEVRLWKLIHEESDPATALTLSLAWQLGLSLEEIVALTWGQVDLEEHSLMLPDRTLAMPENVQKRLLQLCPTRTGETDRVLLTPRSRRPYDKTRLSKLMRAALIRAGLPDLTLRDLQRDHEIRVVGQRKLLNYVRANGTITRSQAAQLLGVSATTAYQRLKSMVRQEQLTQVGHKYYLYGTMVPEDEQAEPIIHYLQQTGFVYRQDVARLLRIEPRQCCTSLRRMVDSGTLQLNKQKYFLKDA